MKTKKPLHDTFDNMFGLIDPDEFETALPRSVSGILPALGLDAVVAIRSQRRINGKMSLERCFYISSLPADVQRLAQAVRA